MFYRVGGEVRWIIRAVLDIPDIELAQVLVPREKCTGDFADYCSHPEVLEWMMESGCTQYNEEAASSPL
jgi:hypothetical protein